MSERKILQMMPAPGWGATFDEEGDELISPLIGWALVQDGAGQSVVGLVARERVEFCDTLPNFTGYFHLEDALLDLSDVEDDEFDYDDEDQDNDEDELDDEPPLKGMGGRLN